MTLFSDTFYFFQKSIDLILGIPFILRDREEENRMNIQELEKRCGVTKQNIRFYERKGLLHPDRNQTNNYREYTIEDVDRLKSIRMLRKIDISIEDIREVLDGRLSMEELMKNHFVELENRQKELDAGIKICKKLLHTQFSEVDTEAVLKEMDELEAKGGKFMNIIDDYKKFTKMEHKRKFSFVPDNMALKPEEFTEALLIYAKENDLNLVITKAGMYPVFEIDGVEYTAERTFGRYGAIIHCQMTHPEKLEEEFGPIPSKRRKWFRVFGICVIPACFLLYFILVSGSVVLGIVMGVVLIPLLAWRFWQ